jgi:hypothetical protein
MFSPKVEECLRTGEWTEEAAAEWDTDDDPDIAEIRRYRHEIQAEYAFDTDRYFAALKVIGYACGDKCVSYDWRNPHGPRECELPADLTGLIPNREKFIAKVRMDRRVAALREPDLAAYNEDARRRALVLGFPAESFVLSEEEVQALADEPLPPWLEYLRAVRAPRYR